MSEKEIHSYPKIHNVGHPEIMSIFDDEVIVEEKVDGSQISFVLRPDGELYIKSKRQMIHVESPEKMFAAGVDEILARKHLLTHNFVYRGEYLKGPKHNVLKYDRIPEGHIIIFDVEISPNRFMSWAEKYDEAKRIGLECVPIHFTGRISGHEQFQELLKMESCLGGVKVEGLVSKNYARFGRDDKVLMAKYVSEAFKETHNKAWKASNPGRTDIIQGIIEGLRTDARWQKALQHLAEEGKLTHTPKDIGLLIKEAKDDIVKEEMEQIKDLLWKHFSGKILRGATAGLPEWYKEKLVERQFGEV